MSRTLLARHGGLAIVALVTGSLVAPAGAMANTFPGRNGLLAYSNATSPGDPDAQIFTIRPDGRGTRTITSGPGLVGPQWSPDGRRIAFSARLDGQESDESDIYVMNADGSDVRRLTNLPGNDVGPSWSPDNKRIVFGHRVPRGDDGGLSIVNADGTGLVALTTATGRTPSDYGPDWSPGGDRIAFVNSSSVWVMKADGTGRKRVVGGDDPTWSPDGKRIAFRYGDFSSGMFAVDANGKNRRLMNTGRAGAWSPDGKKFAVRGVNSVGTPGLFTLDANFRGRPKLRLVTRKPTVTLSWQRVP
jgi:Tol biopolymer transport system component